MMPLTRFLAFHAIIGFGIAMMFMGIVFGYDLAGLSTLYEESQIGWVAASALAFMLCLVCSSIQMGAAILSERKGSPQHYRIRFEQNRIPQKAMVLQPVRAKSRETH